MENDRKSIAIWVSKNVRERYKGLNKPQPFAHFCQEAIYNALEREIIMQKRGYKPVPGFLGGCQVTHNPGVITEKRRKNATKVTDKDA